MIKKVLFDKALMQAVKGGKIAIIASNSVTEEDHYIFSRGCRYFISVLDNAYVIGTIENGNFGVKKRFELVKNSNTSEYNKLLEFLALHFQLDEQNENVFVQAVFFSENEWVDKEQLLAMIHAHQLEEVLRSSYSNERGIEINEIYYRVDMMYLFKFCKALPDFSKSVNGNTLLKTFIQLEIDIDVAAYDFYHN